MAEKKSIVCGSLDPPLTIKGREQARDLGRQFRRISGVDIIVTSAQKRARQTAELVRDYNPSAQIIVVPELHSWYMGKLEGQTIDKVGGIVDELLRDPDKVPPGISSSGQKGESLRTYATNYNEAFNVIRKYALKHPKVTILVITHRRGMALLTELAKGEEVTPIKMKDWTDKKNGQVWRWKEMLGSTRPYDTFEPEEPKAGGGLWVARHGEVG